MCALGFAFTYVGCTSAQGQKELSPMYAPSDVLTQENMQDPSAKLSVQSITRSWFHSTRNFAHPSFIMIDASSLLLTAPLAGRVEDPFVLSNLIPTYEHTNSGHSVKHSRYWVLYAYIMIDN
jgi:hypothetical protein